MKRIIYCINFLFILNLIFAFSSCSHAGNSGNDDEEDVLIENFDPFAGTTWYGDLYKGEYDENLNQIYKKTGTGVLLCFGPESEKNNLMGQEFGYVETKNPIYLFFPKDYEAAKKSKGENAYQLMKNQKLAYSVEKNENGYSACIGFLGEAFRLTISNSNANEGVIKWTSGGYVSYGYEDDKTTWYFNDTLPRTIYKQTE